jgi:RNase_H superfamily
VVEHHATAGHDEIVSDARDRVPSLVTLIEYSTGVVPNISEVQTHAIEPNSEVSLGLGFIKVAATLVCQAPMPPAETVKRLSGRTRMLMGWYLRGQKSESVIDRIKYFYIRDIYFDIHNCVAFPTQDLTLKDVAKYCGFVWRDPSVDGFGAALLYGSGKLTKTKKRALIRYNEDDLLALKCVLHHLEKFVERTQPSTPMQATLL